MLAQVQIQEVLASWLSLTETRISLADDLRCAAMECQEDYAGRVDVRAFCDAAEALGVNRKTANRCWNWVKNNESWSKAA